MGNKIKEPLNGWAIDLGKGSVDELETLLKLLKQFEPYKIGTSCFEFIKVGDNLPEQKHTMGCGNTYSDDVLAFNGEDYFVANLEAVRPDFINKVWSISAGDKIIEYYSGKPVTQWAELPKKQSFNS